MRTDQGQVRDHNEDYVASREPTNDAEASRDGWVYILADGVGGAEAGEVASEFATERTLHHFLSNANTADWSERLQDAIRSANSDLRKMVAEEMEGKRMATTMVATVIHGFTASIVNIGDSRAYLFSDGKLSQITKDHSLVARLLEEGAISEEEALTHPRRNVILHSIGPESEPQIDYYEVDLAPGESILLCSDGLTRHVPDEEISAIIAAESPEDATKKMIHIANERGGEDNISAAVILLGELAGSPEIGPVGPVMVSSLDPNRKIWPRRRILWTYTAILLLIQIVIVVLVWNLLSF